MRLHIHNTSIGFYTQPIIRQQGEAMSQGIQTIYSGDCFKSRLEVRWAIFLKALGFEYEYEKQAYGLLSGWYLPDFWIPRLRVWLEVKPYSGGDIDTLRYRELALSTGCPHLCVRGRPEPNRYSVSVQLPKRGSSIRKASFAESETKARKLILVDEHHSWEVRKGAPICSLVAQPVLHDSVWLNKASKFAGSYFEEQNRN